MVPFKIYVSNVLSEDSNRGKDPKQKALEDAGRYISRMVDIDNQGSDETDSESSLMYNMDALTALHNYFLGQRYSHIKPFEKLGSEEEKRNNIAIVSKNFPHLIPHIESTISSWQ